MEEWANYEPCSTTKEMQPWGCLNMVLDHKTVAAQRYFQAETHQQPLRKRDCIVPCRDQIPLALSSGH